MGQRGEVGEQLLGVDDLARFLDVQPTTIYRWCREGRLPCLKLGKAWRVRRSALDEFLRRGERRATLADHLRTFLAVPDHVVAVAADDELLSRLDAAFFAVGEARGGSMVKFYAGETRTPDELRVDFRRHGFDVDRLETEGRFRWSAELDPAAGRAATLRAALADETAAGRSLWVSFNWARDVPLQAALAQQERLAALVDVARLVVKTAALATVADEWTPEAQRRLLRSHRGQIRVSPDGVLLSRSVPLPPA